MKKKYHVGFFIVFLIFSSYEVNCQNRIITNIDTTYLQPKWTINPLSVSKFRNGKNIFKCEDVNTFSKINKPAYYVKKIDGIDQYFYNQRVLIQIDGDTIAPLGYKIADYNDYKNNLKKQKINSVSNNYIFPNNLIDLDETYFSIKFNGWIDEYFFLDPEDKFIWTSKFTSSSEFGTAAKFTKNKTNNNIEFTFQEINRGYGCQIYCVQNLEETVVDSIFDYKKLLPDDYRSLLQDLSKVIQSENLGSKEFNYKLLGKINCDNSGKFSGNLNFLNKEKNDKLLIDKLNTKLQNYNTIPYYHGIILRARADLNLEFALTNQLLKPTKYFALNVAKLTSDQKELANRAEFLDFKIKRSKETVIVKDDGKDILKRETISINRFYGKGPTCALASVIPGLGLTLVSNKKSYANSENRKSARITFLISSLTLGSISISSKIYSNAYYSKYRNDLSNPIAESNYKKANTAQKIFLSTGFAYCVLGVIDFTWTFSIGCRNKKVQKKLNGILKTNPSTFN